MNETNLPLATARRTVRQVFIGRRDFVTSSTDVGNWGLINAALVFFFSSTSHECLLSYIEYIRGNR